MDNKKQWKDSIYYRVLHDRLDKINEIRNSLEFESLKIARLAKLTDDWNDEKIENLLDRCKLRLRGDHDWEFFCSFLLDCTEVYTKLFFSMDMWNIDYWLDCYCGGENLMKRLDVWEKYDESQSTLKERNEELEKQLAEERKHSEELEKQLFEALSSNDDIEKQLAEERISYEKLVRDKTESDMKADWAVTSVSKEAIEEEILWWFVRHSKRKPAATRENTQKMILSYVAKNSLVLSTKLAEAVESLDDEQAADPKVVTVNGNYNDIHDNGDVKVKV